MSHDSACAENEWAFKDVLNVKEVNELAVFNAKAKLGGTIRSMEVIGAIVDKFFNNSDLHVTSRLDTSVTKLIMAACLAFITLNCDQVSGSINDC